MKSCVIVFPGSNREDDAIRAIAGTGARAPLPVWHADTHLPRCDLVVLPGGFSYGDYLRPGAIAARAPIMRAIADHAAQGRLLLGICNGFQILTECGLLPGVLQRNRALRFICKQAHVRVCRTDTPFTHRYRNDQVMRVPIAHHDGNYFADADTLARLEDEAGVVLRYCNTDGQVTAAANPNGSRNNIAGIINKNANILGLMPHAENAVDHRHGGTDGQALFAALYQR